MDEQEVARSICKFAFAEKPDVLRQALAVTGAIDSGPHGNKPLAFTGDKVIGLYCAIQGLDRGLGTNEMNDRIQSVANNKVLATLCKQSGLDACISNQPGQSRTFGTQTLTDTLRAVIAAAYLCGGMTAAETVMNALDLFGSSP